MRSSFPARMVNLEEVTQAVASDDTEFLSGHVGLSLAMVSLLE